MITNGGFKTNSGEAQVNSVLIATPALGAVAAALAAVNSDGSYHKWFSAAAIWTAPQGVAKKVTATVSGNAANVKNIQVTVIGTDAANAPLTEALPAFTLDTIGTVTSVGAFKTITEIRIPAHDGTDVSTSLSYEGGAVGAVIPAWADKGLQTIHKTATVTQPAVARNLTATAGGTNTDIKNVAVIVNGKNADGTDISETLPVFTLDTAGTVTGNKAFKSITSIEIPNHDGNGATTSLGTGAKLGLGSKISRDTILQAYLNGVREGTRPTVAFSGSAMESNTVTLNSALNGTDVIVDFLQT